MEVVNALNKNNLFLTKEDQKPFSQEQISQALTEIYKCYQKKQQVKIWKYFK